MQVVTSSSSSAVQSTHLSSSDDDHDDDDGISSYSVLSSVSNTATLIELPDMLSITIRRRERCRSAQVD